ncbi:MAG: RNA polymerase sigma factor [Pirellulales bacterium]
MAPDAAVVERLYKAFAGRLQRAAAVLLPDGMKHDNEDVVQETFVRFLRRPKMKCLAGGDLSNPDVEKQCFAFLHEIMQRTCYRLVKRAAREARPMSDAPRERSADEIVAKPPADHAATDAVLRSIFDLSEPDREIIVLYYFENFSYRTIGRIMRIPEGTVASRLHRIKAELKDVLRPYL